MNNMHQIENKPVFKPFTELELKAAQLLTEDKKSIVMAKNEEKIGNYTEKECKNAIYALIAQTIELSGKDKKGAYDTQTLKNVTKFLYDWLIDKYKGATLSELKLSFGYGIAGEYGDYVGFGVATFTKFFKGYMDSVRRSTAMKEWGQTENNVRDSTNFTPITEIFRANKLLTEHLLKLWSPELSRFIKSTIYVTKEDDLFHLPSIYDFIRANYGTNFSDETKAKVLKSAKISYANFIKESGLKEKDQKAHDLIIQSVKMGDNKTFDYHCKTEGLKATLNFLKNGKHDLEYLNKQPQI